MFSQTKDDYVPLDRHYYYHLRLANTVCRHSFDTFGNYALLLLTFYHLTTGLSLIKTVYIKRTKH